VGAVGSNCIPPGRTGTSVADTSFWFDPTAAQRAGRLPGDRIFALEQPFTRLVRHVDTIQCKGITHTAQHQCGGNVDTTPVPGNTEPMQHIEAIGQRDLEYQLIFFPVTSLGTQHTTLGLHETQITDQREIVISVYDDAVMVLLDVQHSRLGDALRKPAKTHNGREVKGRWINIAAPALHFTLKLGLRLLVDPPNLLTGVIAELIVQLPVT